MKKPESLTRELLIEKFNKKNSDTLRDIVDYFNEKEFFSYSDDDMVWILDDWSVIQLIENRIHLSFSLEAPVNFIAHITKYIIEFDRNIPVDIYEPHISKYKLNKKGELICSGLLFGEQAERYYKKNFLK